MSGSDLSDHAELVERLRAELAEAITCSCENGWTEDQNWSPEFPEYGATRTEGDGLIPCGLCNLGGWDHDSDKPMPEPKNTVVPLALLRDAIAALSAPPSLRCPCYPNDSSHEEGCPAVLPPIDGLGADLLRWAEYHDDHHGPDHGQVVMRAAAYHIAALSAPSEPGGTTVTQADALAFVAGRWPSKATVFQRAAKLCEEAGEVMGAVIKLDEGRTTPEDLRQEVAQVVLVAMSLAEAASFDLGEAVADEYARATAPSEPGGEVETVAVPKAEWDALMALRDSDTPVDFGDLLDACIALCDARDALGPGR